MITLRLHKVFWCAHHGHPALALHIAESDQCLIVALGTEDALALATCHVDAPSRASRPFALLATVVVELRAQLTALQLHVGPDAMVRAFLHLEGPRGATIMPTHLVDGLALALQQDLPLWMNDDEVARLVAGGVAPAASPVLENLEPYRRFVESLDLEGFGNATV
jgi:hypothetical protein